MPYNLVHGHQSIAAANWRHLHNRRSMNIAEIYTLQSVYRLHGVTTQKTAVLVFTAARTSNPTPKWKLAELFRIRVTAKRVRTRGRIPFLKCRPPRKTLGIWGVLANIFQSLFLLVAIHTLACSSDMNGNWTHWRLQYKMYWHDTRNRNSEVRIDVHC
jgi:hypothetical protein